MKKNLSPSKFKRHIKKEILEFIEYTFRDLNFRSPNNTIQDLLNDINIRSKGLLHARLGYRNRRISISLNLPDNWTITLEDEEENVDKNV